MIAEEAMVRWYRRNAARWSEKHAAQMLRLTRGWIASFGGKEVEALAVADVEKHEEFRDNGKRSGSALNGERTALRAFFKWTIANKWRQDDPTVTWRFRSTKVKRRYVELTREQEAALCAKSPPWLARFVTIAVQTGLREGTLRQLTWDMVEAEELVIPAASMKCREAHRLPIAPKLRAALGERGVGLVLPGLPNASRVWKAFKDAAWRAGLPPEASPHDLRRTFVSRLTEAGCPLQTVMCLGAWSSPGVLLRHYASKISKATAVAAMAAI